MDRRFLLHPAVIEASRGFVCIRILTYESGPEAEFTASLYRGASGQVENTTFGILGPSGRDLIPASRSPRERYRDGEALAAEMREIAAGIPAREGARELPLLSDLRLALNVAAGDDLPLLVLRDASLREPLRARLWEGPVRGRFLVVEAAEGELELLTGEAPEGAGLLIVEAGEYGLSGRIVGAAARVEALDAALAEHQRAPGFEDDFWEHVESGRRARVFWETALPVTDPQERQARAWGER